MLMMIIMIFRTIMYVDDNNDIFRTIMYVDDDDNIYFVL